MSSDSTAMDFYSELERSIIERYRKNRGKSLRDVYEMDRDFLEVDTKMVDFFLDNREKIRSVLDNPESESRILGVFIDNALNFTYRSNQFLQVRDADRVHFEGIYREYLDAIKGLLAGDDPGPVLKGRLKQLLEDHFSRLRNNLARYIETSGESDFVFAKPVCNEYSPELQMEVLGIRENDLREPILDLGCGYTGKLVKHFRARGLAAVGADRTVETSDFLFRLDWSDACRKREMWGTVISHMAFSNHFIFHHISSPGARAAEFALGYKAILSSLASGGSFYYTPGLPFIERFLSPSEYRVTRHIPASSIPTPEIALNAVLGCDVFYSARILKM